MKCSGKWCVVVGWCLLLAVTGRAGAQGSTSVPGASALSAALSQYHGYLLNESGRTTLDEVNRGLRRSERNIERGETEAARADGARERETKAAELIQFLDTVPSLTDLTLPQPPQALPVRQLTLPGDSGALLFRLNPGAGNPKCVVAELDFSGGRDSADAPGIDPARTTYLLVSLRNVPARTVSVRIFLQVAEGLRYTMPLEIATPKQGRLKLAVLSDDTGKPAPAMIRLVWKSNGSEYRPRNALEFAPQFDTQGSSTGVRRANLQGKLAGNYWCVPDPIDMTLPPGEWEVVIRRGTEHIPIIDTFTVAAGETLDKTYRPKRWADMRKSGWYSGDDHIHFQLLSDVDARQAMTWIQAEDVHLGNILKMGDMNRTWFEQRGFGPDFRVHESDYILVPGQECPRTHDQLGHTISLNITDMVRDTSHYYQYDWIFNNVAAQGGLSGFAHVNTDLFHVHRGMTLAAPKDLIDFVELLQFAELGTDLYYDFLNLGFKVTASAGSDVPWGGTVGEVRVYAHTGRGQFTADKWFDAVEQGHTFVTNGPMIDFRVDKAYPGDELAIQPGKKVRVRARTWGASGFTTPVKIEIVKHGEVIAHAEAPASGAEELKLDLDIDPGEGCWLAARAEGTEGYRAHTTPIYLIRDGLRFWNYDAVDALLAKRMASLDEIDALIAEALDKQAKGEIGTNKWMQELVLQSDVLRQRVQEARGQYEALRKIRDNEAVLRAPKAGGVARR